MSDIRRARIASFALALALAGCGGTASSLTAHPGGGQSSMAGTAQAPSMGFSSLAGQHMVLYESSYDYQPGVGQVLVWPAGLNAHPSNPMRSITANTVRPNGMWVDGNGDLYVVNIPQGAPTTGVFVYHPGASVWYRHFKDQLVYPTEIAVAKDGTVYVNQMQGNNIPGDCVTVFPPGSNTASRTIDLNFNGYAHGAGGLAFDRNGNLLAAEFDFKTGLHVFRINTTTFRFKDLGLHGTAGGPGLATDRAGNMYITGSESIDVYAPGSTTPTRTLSGGGYDITARPDGTLYVNGYGAVSEYAPGATSPTNTITSYGNYGEGVAVGPAQ